MRQIASAKTLPLFVLFSVTLVTPSLAPVAMDEHNNQTDSSSTPDELTHLILEG